MPYFFGMPSFSGTGMPQYFNPEEKTLYIGGELARVNSNIVELDRPPLQRSRGSRDPAVKTKLYATPVPEQNPPQFALVTGVFDFSGGANANLIEVGRVVMAPGVENALPRGVSP